MFIPKLLLNPIFVYGLSQLKKQIFKKFTSLLGIIEVVQSCICYFIKFECQDFRFVVFWLYKLSLRASIFDNGTWYCFGNLFHYFSKDTKKSMPQRFASDRVCDLGKQNTISNWVDSIYITLTYRSVAFLWSSWKVLKKGVDFLAIAIKAFYVCFIFT